MLIAARAVQYFLVFCLIIMGQIATKDVQDGGLHAASVVFLGSMLIVLFGMATLAVHSLKKK